MSYNWFNILVDQIWYKLNQQSLKMKTNMYLLGLLMKTFIICKNKFKKSSCKYSYWVQITRFCVAVVDVWQGNRIEKFVGKILFA